ncbi:MAG: hypothetical protein KJP03_03080 [Gammaproteobacteria bacterium]|nr:hypothetical protein [Gammaproteobacteria bacterium]
MPGTRHQRPPLVIAIAVTLALLLVWPAWISVRNGLSGLYARPAIDYLEEKRFDAYIINEAEWQAIENSVMQADQLMPRNPQYLETLGWLHQLKLTLFADELSIEDMDAHANAARDYFEKAIETRPTWPYYWGNLAIEHYRRGNYAANEYSLALANASRFGPWQNDTQRLVIDLGSETWEFLSPRAKQEYILIVERSLHRQPRNTVRLVRDYRAWPKLCEASNGLLDITLPHLHTLCAQERFTEQDGPS